jgi:hypothetical protein
MRESQSAGARYSRSEVNVNATAFSGGALAVSYTRKSEQFFQAR